MAETPITWALLEALQTQLRNIRRTVGYRTDAGLDVRLEPAQFEADAAPRITLYALTTVRPDDARGEGEREVTLVVEALVPVRFDDAQQRIVETMADIEQALDGLRLPTLALPLRFAESVILDRPDGVPAMAAQQLFVTRFRQGGGR
ncbi:MAG: hypothetical protein WAZ48_01325 [Lysobacteraceae bacterium]